MAWCMPHAPSASPGGLCTHQQVKQRGGLWDTVHPTMLLPCAQHGSILPAAPCNPALCLLWGQEQGKVGQATKPCTPLSSEPRSKPVTVLHKDSALVTHLLTRC